MANTSLPVNLAALGRLPQNVAQAVDYTDPFGVTYVTQANAKYQAQVLAGNYYHSMSAVGGVSLPAPNTVNPVCCLWNKQGSGVYVVITKIAISYVSGTTAPGGVFLTFQTGVGNAIGTPISAFTHVDPFNGIVGDPYNLGQAKVGWAPATTTFAVAPAQSIFLDLSYGAVVAATTNGPQRSASDLDGEIVVKPNTAIALSAVVLTTALYNVKISWYPVAAPTPNG